MALSGGEQQEAQRRIEDGLRDSHTSIHYHVCTDTYGSIATAFPNGTSTDLIILYMTVSYCHGRWNGINIRYRLQLSIT